MKILSLGAGVQSSAIFLMSCYGEVERIDSAIFADTGWETKATYKWIGFLKEESKKHNIPIHIVKQGEIKKDALISQVRGAKKNGVRWVSMPLFTKKIWKEQDMPLITEIIKQRRAENKSIGKYGEILSKINSGETFIQNGMIRRQCTYEYKIRILEKKMRLLAGYQPRKRIPPGTIEVWKGISLDESKRANISDRKWISFYYPLIEMRMTRVGCLAWFKKRGIPRAPRSACIGCPYHSNAEWRRLRDESPTEFQDAVEFDKAIRKNGGIRGDVFIHAKRIPLDEVDLRTDFDKGQIELPFRDECSGVCGV